MILAIDMGNSNIVVGGLDDNKTYFEERITTDDRKTSLEYAILLKNILEIHKVKKNDIEDDAGRVFTTTFQSKPIP